MSSHLKSSWLKFILIGIVLTLGLEGFLHAAGSGSDAYQAFPPALGTYNDAHMGLLEKLVHRAKSHPFNIAAALIFLFAIIHTFFAGKFHQIGEEIQKKYIRQRIEENSVGKDNQDVSFLGRIFHFLGEVEAIFGIWVLALLIALTVFHGWDQARNYMSHDVYYVEPMFVVVIMAMASTRPILNLSENVLTGGCF